MARTSLPKEVALALERWVAEGLLPPATATHLRAEAEAHAERASRRRGQYLVGITAAAVLVLAAGAFAAWSWPLLSAGVRSTVLLVAGVLVAVTGRVVAERPRWRPGGELLEAAGLSVLLVAFEYSSRAWPDRSAGGVAVGVLALAAPVLGLPAALARGRFMAAVHAALSFAFLGIFLDRAVGLGGDALVWTLDAVLVAATTLLVLRLRAVARSGESETPWALPAFAGAMYAGLVLVMATAMGPLGLTDQAAWAADAWLAVVTALTLWGLHRAPPALQLDGLQRQLELCVILAIPLAFWTVLGALSGSNAAAALVVAGVGVAGLAYGLRQGASRVAMAGCLAVLAAAWFYAAEEGRGLGAVVALAFTAGLLFWLSGRIGGAAADEEDEPPEPPVAAAPTVDAGAGPL